MSRLSNLSLRASRRRRSSAPSGRALAVVGALPDKVERTTITTLDDGRRTAAHQRSGLARRQADQRRRHLQAGLRAASCSSRPAAATGSCRSTARAAASAASGSGFVIDRRATSSPTITWWRTPTSSPSASARRASRSRPSSSARTRRATSPSAHRPEGRQGRQAAPARLLQVAGAGRGRDPSSSRRITIGAWPMPRMTSSARAMVSGEVQGAGTSSTAGIR